MNYRAILEHFEGALLYVEEGFRESRDLSVERSRRLGFYCIAQWTDRRGDPAVEEDALNGEVALLHRDEVAHRVAECGDVVLGLRCLFPARETEGGKLAAQLGKRRFARVTDGISAGIECNGRLAGADKHCVVLVAYRLGVGLRRGPAEPLPGCAYPAGGRLPAPDTHSQGTCRRWRFRPPHPIG